MGLDNNGYQKVDCIDNLVSLIHLAIALGLAVGKVFVVVDFFSWIT